jgi:hypothetical protein
MDHQRKVGIKRRMELAEAVCRELASTQEQIDMRGATCSPNLMHALKEWQKVVKHG